MSRIAKLHAADQRAQKAAPTQQRQEQLPGLPMDYDIARGAESYINSIRRSMGRYSDDGSHQKATDAEVLQTLSELERMQVADIISTALLGEIYNMDRSARVHDQCRALAGCRRALRHLTSNMQSRVEALRKEANTISRALRAATK